MHFPGIGGASNIKCKLVRIVDDSKLLEKVPDDVGGRRLGLDVQHLDRVARKIE